MVELEAEKKDVDMITKAHLAAERLESANKINEALIKRMEAFEARRLLGGESSAGELPKPEISEEEKLKIGMKHYFKDTAIEGALK
jgi:hypothetical protein